MKILAIDPGEKRLGLAISDPTATLSRPLAVIKHVSREKDAEKIIEVAHDENVNLIIVGWALDSNGEIGAQARKSERLANVIRSKCKLSVLMWDESGTTQEALRSRIALGVSRKKRKGHLDDLAASMLLQDFLDQNASEIKNREEHFGN
jgi:putative Holliday junction resolvase